MKRIFTIAILCTITFSFNKLFAQTPTVYINLVSHNEDSYVYYINNPNAYHATRAEMISMATLCQSKGAFWHLGTDWCLPIATMRHDTGTVIQTTNNKNILRYLSEDLGVAIDPHSHESSYNYTDITHLLDSLGVNYTSTMSGFLVNQDQNGHYWEDYQNPVAGDSFPQTMWQPATLWGAGTPGHTNDPTSMGIWRPTDSSGIGFITHAPSNHLINYGQGCKMKYTNGSDVHAVLEPLRDLISALQQGLLDTNKIYCTSIFFTEAQLTQPFFINKSNELIDSVNAYVANGSVTWMRIDSVADLWKNNHGNIGSVSSCQDWAATSRVEGNPNSNLKFYPNPANGKVIVELPFENHPTYQLNAIDMTGGSAQLKYQAISNRKIQTDVGHLPQGIYLLEINQVRTKIVVE